MSKLPPYAFEKDIFYLRPKQVIPPNPSNYWYECAAVGREKLCTVVKDMCLAAGISEPKTNHSDRATGATSMFASNVPERMIQSYTGHKSLEALRKYECPTHDQHQEILDILTANDKRSFGTDITNKRVTQTSSQTTASQIPGMLFRA